MKAKYFFIILILIGLIGIEITVFIAASNKKDEQTTSVATTTLATTTIKTGDEVPAPYDIEKYTEFTYEVVNEYPHYSNAFTQGLVYDNGFLYEGTGLKGQSSLRKLNFTTGQIVNKVDLDKQYFGEGIAILNSKIYQLTWQDKVGFIYDKDTFNKLGEFEYDTEGWGLTHDGTNLILSDGTPSIYYISPNDFEIVRRIDVYDSNGPISNINELECIYGNIFANVWLTDQIVIINSLNGTLLGRIDLTGLLKASDRTTETDVLNGIAFDYETNRLFVTGKNWPKVFEIKLIKSDRTG